MPRNGTVLVVDDEEIMREILEALLAREGYEVRLASSGEEALEIARKVPVDAAVVGAAVAVVTARSGAANAAAGGLTTIVPSGSFVMFGDCENTARLGGLFTGSNTTGGFCTIWYARSVMNTRSGGRGAASVAAPCACPPMANDAR